LWELVNYRFLTGVSIRRPGTYRFPIGFRAIYAFNIPQSEHPTTSNTPGQRPCYPPAGHHGKVRRDGYRTTPSADRQGA
jgi:hypothetical protein